MKHITLLFIGFALSFTASAQIGGWNPELENESREDFKKRNVTHVRSGAWGRGLRPSVTSRLLQYWYYLK